MIVSPTEPPALKAIGSVSMLPERYGCDLLFAAGGKFYGVQRKEFKDFIASVADGRLGQQVAQMQNVEQAMVVIEGEGRWTDDGVLLDRYADMTRSSMRKLLWSVRDRGIWVDFTEGLGDTIQLVKAFEEWCKKGGHTSLMGRPKPQSQWGKAANRDFQIHLLQGVPGVGVELAQRIVEKFGGVPWSWDVGVEELMTVDGIGKTKAARMMEVLR